MDEVMEHLVADNLKMPCASIARSADTESLYCRDASLVIAVS